MSIIRNLLIEEIKRLAAERDSYKERWLLAVTPYLEEFGEESNSRRQAEGELEKIKESKVYYRGPIWPVPWTPS